MFVSCKLMNLHWSWYGIHPAHNPRKNEHELSARKILIFFLWGGEVEQHPILDDKYGTLLVVCKSYNLWADQPVAVQPLNWAGTPGWGLGNGKKNLGLRKHQGRQKKIYIDKTTWRIWKGRGRERDGTYGMKCMHTAATDRAAWFWQGSVEALCSTWHVVYRWSFGCWSKSVHR